MLQRHEGRSIYAITRHTTVRRTAWSWELGAGSWELGAGSWELGAGSWALGAGSWAPGSVIENGALSQMAARVGVPAWTAGEICRQD
ncbi:hypothetical protein BCR39DRAFT_230061 [Naematelia encephala]|uniref:Uncharacterized protein n=1 Tax=Naematelia encephala TaxID=71784 RepID=A0A1Y2AYR0_9TREE|nr:hypothetical protein BCR39DRAFT_230061 [Naematelia encephala]